MNKKILKIIFDWRDKKINDLKILYQQIFTSLGFSINDSLFSYNFFEKNVNHKEFSQLKTKFNEIDDKFIIYIISNSLHIEYIFFHHILIYLLTDKQLSIFQPGILSFYFKILNENHDNKLIKFTLVCIKLILSRNIELEKKGKEMLFHLLTTKLFSKKEISNDICDILNVCKNFFENDQKVIILEFLINNDVQISIEEYFSLIDKVVKEFNKCKKLNFNIKKSVDYTEIQDYNNLNFFNKNKNDFNFFNINNYILIYKIQKSLNNFYPKIECDVTFKELIKFNGLHILKYYIDNKHARKCLKEKCDIKKISYENENIVISYIYDEIYILKTKYKELLEYSIICEDHSVIKKSNYSKHKELCEFIKKLNKILDFCIEYKNLNYKTNIEFIINSLISFFDILDKDSILKIFELMEFSLNKINIKKLIEYINEIIYLDLDSVEIRSKKYNIIDKIFLKIFTHDKNINNYLPLIAKLWDEISIIPENGEISSVLKLLSTIIKNTKTFYERRLTKSKIIDFLFKHKKLFMHEFIIFLNEITTFFLFENIVLVEKIWNVVFEIYDKYDVTLIIKNLIKKKKFLSFYIIFNQNKLDEKFKKFIKIDFIKNINKKI